MAWSRRTGAGGRGTGTAGSASYTVTFLIGCLIGDRVVVVVAVKASTSDGVVSSVTGTFCGTFTKDAETAYATGVSGIFKVSIWSAPVTSAGTPVLTINQTGSSVAGSASAQGYIGLSTDVGPTAVDVAAANQQSSISSSSPTVTTGTTNAANELDVGGFGDAGESAIFTGANGLSVPVLTDNTNANADSAIADKDSGSVGAQTMNGTIGSKTSGWGMVGVVYKLLTPPAGLGFRKWPQPEDDRGYI